MSETRPWLQEGAPNGVKSLLESARHDEPTAAQLARMAAKLGPLLVPSSAAAAAASASSSSAVAPAVKAAVIKVGVVTKVAIAAVTIAAVGGGAFQSGRVYQERTTPPPAPALIQLPPIAVAPPVPVVEPEPAAVVEPPPPAPKAVAAAPALMTPDAEVALLKSAMAAQGKGDAALALSLSQQHLKRFPHGNFEQEREVIAIEALVGLGRRDEAKVRATSFAKKFPTSTHLLKVESLVR